MGASHPSNKEGKEQWGLEAPEAPEMLQPAVKPCVLRWIGASEELQAFLAHLYASKCVLSSFYSQWFQSTVSKEESMPETLKSLIFPNFEPLHKFHTNFLKEIEQRLALWWVHLCFPRSRRLFFFLSPSNLNFLLFLMSGSHEQR